MKTKMLRYVERIRRARDTLKRLQQRVAILREEARKAEEQYLVVSRHLGTATCVLHRIKSEDEAIKIRGEMIRARPSSTEQPIAQDLVDRVRAANSIEVVIGNALPLKKLGKNFVGLCPFHREKSPSFNVNPHKQIFHCFGCHKGGDVIKFVQEYENLSFSEAVGRLAAPGIHLEKTKS